MAEEQKHNIMTAESLKKLQERYDYLLNVKRKEIINAIEIALAYEHLLENEGMTQEKISERVGKSRAAIANYLRLLKLPAQVQMALQKKIGRAHV